MRDLARVDRALGELPALEAVFLAGRIGWRSLRLLCRVARAEDEGAWLAFSGVVRCSGTAADALRFELGVRPGRAPLVAYGPGEVIAMRG